MQGLREWNIQQPFRTSAFMRFLRSRASTKTFHFFIAVRFSGM
jgi:hypothetical protein